MVKNIVNIVNVDGKKRYNGDDHARSSTHTGQCTRKYESNLKTTSKTNG